MRAASCVALLLREGVELVVLGRARRASPRFSPALAVDRPRTRGRARPRGRSRRAPVGLGVRLAVGEHGRVGQPLRSAPRGSSRARASFSIMATACRAGPRRGGDRAPRSRTERRFRRRPAAVRGRRRRSRPSSRSASSSATIATSSMSSVGSWVVMLLQHEPRARRGPRTAAPRGAGRSGAAARRRGPAITGTSSSRPPNLTRKGAVLGISAKTRIDTSSTKSRKLVPQRGWSRLWARAFSTVSGSR